MGEGAARLALPCCLLHASVGVSHVCHMPCPSYVCHMSCPSHVSHAAHFSVHPLRSCSPHLLPLSLNTPSRPVAPNHPGTDPGCCAHAPEWCGAERQEAHRLQCQPVGPRAAGDVCGCLAAKCGEGRGWHGIKSTEPDQRYPGISLRRRPCHTPQKDDPSVELDEQARIQLKSKVDSCC